MFAPKLLAALALACALTAVQLPAASAQNTWPFIVQMDLSGAEEVPPVTTEAFGNFRWVLYRNGTVTWRLTVRNIVAMTMAHIHRAAKGSNGGVQLWLVDKRSSPLTTAREVFHTQMIPFPTFNGGYTPTTFVELVRNGSLYVNVHTTAKPGGEIRGQLVELPKP